MLKQTFCATFTALAILSTPVPISQATASEKIFNNMSGKFRGKGLVKASAKGKKEAIRCRMNNSIASPKRINLSGNCSVTGFVFSLRGFIEQTGGSSYKANMFRSLANLKQSNFSGKRSGSRIKFSFNARDAISKSDVKASIVLNSANAKSFTVQISRTDPKTKKIFNVGTLKFSK